MDFIPAQCPNCGGELMLPKAKDDAICTYCGTRFLLKDVASKTPSPTVENWLFLAQSALESGNARESYDFYNRVLEVDSRNFVAWLGKGTSAGWLSTVADLRITEMLNCFSKAIEYSDESNRDENKKKIVFVGSNILGELSKLTTNFLVQYMQVDNSWSEFVSQSQIIMIGVDYVLDLDPNNSVALLVGIWTTTALVNGIEYKDYNDDIYRKGVSEQLKPFLLDKREKYVEVIKIVDPTLDIPKIEKKVEKKKSG